MKTELNINSLKVGDKLKCVTQNTSLEEGVVYTVRDFDREFIYLKEVGYQGFYPWRFEKAEEYTNQANLNQSENQSMNSKRFVVRVGQNKDLARVVLDLLYKKGYIWEIDGKEPNLSKIIDLYGHRLAFCVGYHNNNNKISYSPYDGESFLTVPIHFNAETEFGKFLSYLNAPEIPTILIRNTEGVEYKADFQKNPGHVTFGCALIDNQTFVALSECLKTKISPNSKSVQSIQIGKGVFKPSDIQAIVEHPEFGK